MPLTVKDILEKTFKRSFKGYDEDEVDRFLDQVIDEFKVLQAENESLKKSLAETSERLSRVSETETTIMNTLVSAQKSSERLLAEAARKAELIIDSAQTTATQRAEQAQAELTQTEKRLEEVKMRTERRLEEIKAYAAQFAESFANLVNSQAASFQEAYRTYFGEPESPHGINIEAAKRISVDLETGLKDIGVIESVTEEPAEPPAPPVQDEEPAQAAPVEADVIAEATPAEVDMPAEAATEAEAIAEAASAEVDTPAETDAFADAAPAEPVDTPAAPSPPDKGVMSLQEINKALQELEEQDGSILSDDEVQQDAEPRPRYDDYSWLYDSESTESVKEVAGKDDEELKSLIDEVID